MGNFNKKSIGTRTVNLAGGIAYSESPELELISLLLTSFAQDQYYRTAEETFAQVKELLTKVNPIFAAKAALYARCKIGMRSISHVLAAELEPYLKNTGIAKKFYHLIAHRVDDITEICSYHAQNIKKESKKGKCYPTKAMAAGFRRAFESFDEYQLAKYKSSNNQIKLIDIVNSIHPKGNEKNKKALELLVKGQLKATKTSSAEMSAIGQKKDISDEERKELIKENWTKRIQERQIGYMDLVKNLRNIIQQAPEAIELACDMLVQEKLIDKSKILPFRFMTASEEISKLDPSDHTRKIIVALDKAIDLSAQNVPKFDGRTCVILDCSGSMTSSPGRTKTPQEIGALFTACLIKTNQCDLILFGDQASYVQYNPLDSITSLTTGLKKINAGGTDFNAPIKCLTRTYDRLIILSDMQGWLNNYALKSTFTEYKKKYSADPQIWSFDLSGYGSLQFPERNVFCVAGFSQNVFDIMQKLSQDKNALINEVNKIEL